MGLTVTLTAIGNSFYVWLTESFHWLAARFALVDQICSEELNMNLNWSAEDYFELFLEFFNG